MTTAIALSRQNDAGSRTSTKYLLQMANANLYHVTKCPLYLSFTVHHFYT